MSCPDPLQEKHSPAARSATKRQPTKVKVITLERATLPKVTHSFQGGSHPMMEGHKGPVEATRKDHSAPSSPEESPEVLVGAVSQLDTFLCLVLLPSPPFHDCSSSDFFLINILHNYLYLSVGFPANPVCDSW